MPAQTRENVAHPQSTTESYVYGNAVSHNMPVVNSQLSNAYTYSSTPAPHIQSMPMPETQTQMLSTSMAHSNAHVRSTSTSYQHMGARMPIMTSSLKGQHPRTQLPGSSNACFYSHEAPQPTNYVYMPQATMPGGVPFHVSDPSGEIYRQQPVSNIPQSTLTSTMHPYSPSMHTSAAYTNALYEHTTATGHATAPHVPMSTFMNTGTLHYPTCEPMPATSTASSLFLPTHDNQLPTQPVSNLATLTERVSLPKPELMYFDGNPKDYFKFVTNFECNLACKVSNNKSKLSYLIQYCTGEAKRLIEDCVLYDPEEGYVHACSLLQEKYGRPHTIARSYIDNLTNGSAIKANDVKGLVELSEEMQRCKLTLSKLGFMSDVNSTQTLRCIVKRLPSKIRGEWVDKADWLIQKNKDPVFEDLCDFIKHRARVSSTMYGQEFADDSKIKSQTQGKTNKGYDRGKRLSSFATQSCTVTQSEPKEAKSKESVHTDKSPAFKPRPCSMCKGDHFISKCSKFIELKLNERETFIRSNRLCFNCLKYGHSARECRGQPQCNKCKGKHNDLVHNKNRIKGHQTNQVKENSSDDQVTEANVHCTNNQVQNVALRIIPVCIDYRGKSIETYALLDSGSDVTLCDERLLKELDIRGSPRAFSISTINQTSHIEEGCQVSLTVRSINNSESVCLENVLSVKHLPISLANLPSASAINRWPHLSGISFPKINASQVTLLIGSDVPEVFWTLEERRGKPKEPYAIRSLLGWTLQGPLGTPHATSDFQVNFQQADLLEAQMERMWKTDFSDSISDTKTGMSVEDRQALQCMETTVTTHDGKYMVALPWRHNPMHLPNNRVVAEARLRYLKRKLNSDANLKEAYANTVNDYIHKGYAAKVDDRQSTEEKPSGVWYLPHHPVHNPNKPGKLRVVFDCAAKYQGTSLNANLLQGPDMMNNLVGVLIRFRQDPIAIVGDIEAMFHQVKVTRDDINYLRFLWWTDGDLNKPPDEYCMTVHLFGATSSPSCTAFCLKKTAEDNKHSFSSEAVAAVHRNMYVDDCLKSVSKPTEGIKLVEELRTMLQRGGFRLTKWVSNSREVLDSIPASEKAPSVANLTLDDKLPYEKTLGLQWNIESDVFSFNVNLKEKPATRRGILSVTSSLYDPLGLVAPVILLPKLMLQDFCRAGLGWDDQISAVDEVEWHHWLESLTELSTLSIDRCFKPQQFSKDAVVELHHFADGSEKAYGAASYLRVYDTNNVRCSLIIGKARLAPIKTISIPRLELSAAVVAVRLHKLILDELDLKVNKTVFWTDSVSTIQYIRNKKKRFKTFIANRLAIIHDVTEPADWKYIPSEINPADLASRGIQPSEKSKLKYWLEGPEFLKSKDNHFPAQPENLAPIDENDCELKRTTLFNTTRNGVTELIHRHSSWHSLKKSFAWLLRYKQFCCKTYLRRTVSLPTGRITTKELEHAEVEILKHEQREAYDKELRRLTKPTAENCRPTVCVPKTSSLVKLSPIFEDGLLKVGGRLQNLDIQCSSKHQVILPSKSHVTKLIIRYFHESNGHIGRQQVLAMIRQSYWITRGTSTIKRVIGDCFSCKRQLQNPSTQLMAPLPQERLTPDKPPFTFVGVDFFGPVFVKYGRNQCKRYGCLFTCLTTRAVHIEIAYNLNTNSFLAALQRFTSRRGKPKKIFSDNGTNFTSGERELNESIASWNQQKLHDKCLQQNIEWHFNPPYASHMGGVWERLVKSTKRILKALVKEQLLTDEGLLTFMAEAESILNDRPITPVSNDVKDPLPLSPNQLLTMKPSSCLPQGVFSKQDCYGKRWWRQVQYMANIFWKRWLKEYLPLLQCRSKWLTPQRNMTIGDLVLLVEENTPRGQWPLGIVTDVKLGRDGLVRSVRVRVGHSTKVRPITKLCLLEQSE